jgi:hypothetical protein
MSYTDGDLVWVNQDGWYPGVVVKTDADGGLLVEGPYVGAGEVLFWAVEPADALSPDKVRPRQESLNGQEDRVNGLMKAMEDALFANKGDQAVLLAARAERLAAVVDARRRSLGQHIGAGA